MDALAPTHEAAPSPALIAFSQRMAAQTMLGQGFEPDEVEEHLLRLGKQLPHMTSAAVASALLYEIPDTEFVT
jgi:hypothetical protein